MKHSPIYAQHLEAIARALAKAALDGRLSRDEYIELMDQIEQQARDSSDASRMDRVRESEVDRG